MEISLRDYFAAKAMQGLLSCAINQSIDGIKTDSHSRKFSKLAYVIADAMIEARKNTEDNTDYNDL